MRRNKKLNLFMSYFLNQYKMKRKFLYLPIESKIRELDSKLLIALEAIKNDYVVIIGSKSFMRYMKFLPKGVVFYMNCTSPMFEKFKNYNTYGHKVVVHDEEALAPSDWNDYLRRRIVFDTIKKVHLFFSWGEEQKNVVEGHLNMINSDCVVKSVGHPRIDLLRKPIRNYNKVKKEKIILINTKFAEVNHRTGKDGWLKILNHHDMIKNSDELNFRLEQVKYKKNLMGQYLDLIKSISHNFSDFKIIVRPHPNENINTWILSTKGFKNVEVTNKKPVGFWLQKASIIIHTHCTSAIEGFILDKPVLSFEPFKDSRFEISLPKSVSITVNSTIDCISQINNSLKLGSNFGDHKKTCNTALSKSIDSLVGDFSFKKIVNEIELLSLLKYKFTILLKFRIALIMKLEILVNIIKFFLGKNNPHHNFNFSKEEIETTLIKLSDSVDFKRPISLTKLAKDTFILEA